MARTRDVKASRTVYGSSCKRVSSTWGRVFRSALKHQLLSTLKLAMEHNGGRWVDSFRRYG